MVETKNYRISEDWSIDCTTHTDYWGNKTYSLFVLMEGLSWKDIVQKHEHIKDKDEANRLFQRLVKSIKTKKVVL